MISPLLITLTHECPDGGKARCVHEECIRALGGVKCAVKREVAGFNIKLSVMLIPVHLWLSAVAAFNNNYFIHQFTNSDQLKPATTERAEAGFRMTVSAEMLPPVKGNADADRAFEIAKVLD